MHLSKFEPRAPSECVRPSTGGISMPKKETAKSRVSKIAGKGLSGDELTKKEQAAVNASATSQDETPKKEKKKAEKKKAEKEGKRSDRRPVHHSCHATRGAGRFRTGMTPRRSPRLTFSTGLAAYPRFHLDFTPTSAYWLGRGFLRREHPPRSPNSGPGEGDHGLSRTAQRPPQTVRLYRFRQDYPRKGRPRETSLIISTLGGQDVLATNIW